MNVTFTCATCGGPVGYDLVTVKTNELRQYGVHHYKCSQPCQTCDEQESVTDAPAFGATGQA
jgi:hypothetical protein